MKLQTKASPPPTERWPNSRSERSSHNSDKPIPNSVLSGQFSPTLFAQFVQRSDERVCRQPLFIGETLTIAPEVTKPPQCLFLSYEMDLSAGFK